MFNMETPSPVKRKAAAIDLTRSDSEDEGPETAAARHRDRVRRRRRGADAYDDHALGDARVESALREGARGPGDGFPERLICACRQKRWAQHGHPRLGRGDVAQDPRPRRRQAHGAHAHAGGRKVCAPTIDRLHRAGGRGVCAQARRPVRVPARGPAQMRVAARAPRLFVPPGRPHRLQGDVASRLLLPPR